MGWPECRRAFLWREQRKVQRDATLALQGNRFQVDPRMPSERALPARLCRSEGAAGRPLELRFDPFDLSQIELYLDHAPLGIASVVSQNHQRHLAVERLATEPLAPPKPKSSMDFLAALRAEYQTQQQQQLGRLEFARLTPPTAEPPSQPTPEEE